MSTNQQIHCAKLRGLPIGQFLLLVTVLFLQACATVTTTLPDGSQTTRSIPEFEQYAETVFKRQNLTTTRIGELMEEELDDEAYNKLEAAEETLLNKCAAINQIARDRIEQKDSNVLLQLKVKQTIGECDYATRQAEQLLDRIE